MLRWKMLFIYLYPTMALAMAPPTDQAVPQIKPQTTLQTVLQTSTISHVLSSGRSLTLAAPDQATVQVEDGKILKVVDLGESVSIVARQIGETRVHVNDQTYQFNVVPKKTFHLYSLLQKHFSNYSFIQPVMVDDHIHLSGRFFSVKALRKLFSLPPNNGRWRLSVHPRQENTASIQHAMNQQLAFWGLPPAELQFAGNTKLLVAAKNGELLNLYRSALKSYGIEVELLPQAIKPDKMVQIQLAIAEVKKGHLQRYGLKWPTQLQAEVLPKLEWQTGNDASLFQLDLLESQGQGKLLASPNLLCESGKEAEFMAGGEIPIPSGFGHDVLWKKHGILLKIKPTVFDDNQVQIHLTTEISSLDFANSINGIPGLVSNRLSTVFNLDRPQPIVLSGLLKNERGQQVDGMPILSRVPIIGPLFSSRNYYRNKTELIIVVLPKVVSSEEVKIGEGQN